MLPLSDQDARCLRDASAAADAAGMLQPEQQALVHRRGWLKMLAPLDRGGAELPLPAAVRIEEAIAAADGSAGWVVTLCAGAGWFAGFLPPALAQEILDTPGLCVAGSGAPSGFADRDGSGYRISGQWGHASGAPIATHFTLNAVLRDAGRPLLDPAGAACIRAFIVPAAEVEIVPTWHAIGLRATASHAFRIRDRWVPASHGFDIDAAAATHPGPLYRFPFLPLALVTLAANLAGMAQHFIELARTLVGQRRHPLGEARLGDSAGVQTMLRQAEDALAAARDRFHALLDAAWAHVESGSAIGAPDTQALQAASLALVRAARVAVDGLYPHCGLQAADLRSEINRVWRDFHTATQHALWSLEFDTAPSFA